MYQAQRGRLAKLAAAVVLSLGLVSEALADASEPNVSFSSTRVSPGQSIDITVRNCQSGSNSDVGYYVATIEWEIFTPSGTLSEQASAQTDDSDGITDFTTSADSSTQPGVWKYDWRCVHSWRPPPEPGEATYWSETTEVEVLPLARLTAAEKKKCNRKPTAAARRRCKQLQAAD